jgi:hypothetical protein
VNSNSTGGPVKLTGPPDFDSSNLSVQNFGFDSNRMLELAQSKPTYAQMIAACDLVDRDTYQSDPDTASTTEQTSAGKAG